MGSLLGASGLLGAAGFGRAAATSHNETEPDEVIHLDYGAYGSWNDIYRMSNGDPDNISIVSSPTYDGDTAIELRVRENNHWGISTHYDFDDGLFELNGRIAFALNSNWSMGSQNNCRILNCAMSFGPGSAGGGNPDGTNGWSNRLYVSTRETDQDGPFHLLSYSYHMDQNQDHDFLLEGEPYAVTQPEIVPGQWYEFEYYVRVNTSDGGTANPDGVVRYWLDDALIYDRQDFRFTEDYDDNLLESTGPAGFYGGQYVAPQNLSTYYANHSMSLNGRFEDAPDEPEGSNEPETPIGIELPDGIELPEGIQLPTL